MTFKTRSIAIVAIVPGISSNEFSDNTNSSSISRRPTSGGKTFILFPFNINLRSLLSFPSSGGNWTIKLNDARSSLNRDR